MLTLIVTDANVLIDLALINKHDLLFLPDWSVFTTYEIFYELRPNQRRSWQPYIERKDLRLEEVPSDLIEAMRREVSSSLSDEDCTVLVLAEQKKAIILSGDRAIVKTYRKRGKNAHGILWLLDEHATRQSCTPTELQIFLRELMRVNEWLPIKECQQRLRSWVEEE